MADGKKVHKFRRETFSFTSSKKHSFIFREKEKKNENLSSRSNCMKFEERQKKKSSKMIEKGKNFLISNFLLFWWWKMSRINSRRWMGRSCWWTWFWHERISLRGKKTFVISNEIWKWNKNNEKLECLKKNFWLDFREWSQNCTKGYGSMYWDLLKFN